MRALGLLLLAVPALAADPESPSAFRFPVDKAVKRSVDIREVRRGVSGLDDPRDKIPAIRTPVVVKAAEAVWLPADERVLGVVVGGEARAYPLPALELHELVNDTLGGVPIAPNY